MRAMPRQPKRTAAHSKDICAHVLIAVALLLLGMRRIVAVRGITDWQHRLGRITQNWNARRRERAAVHREQRLRVKCEVSPRRGVRSHGHVSGERTSSLAG